MTVVKQHISFVVIVILILWAPVIHGQETGLYNSSKRKPIELKKARSLLSNSPLKSLEILELYLKKHSKSIDPVFQSEAYHLIGKSYFKLGQHDLSIKNYKRALGRIGSNTKYKRSISVAPADPEIYYDLSLAYKEKGSFQEALIQGDHYLTLLSNRTGSQMLFGLLNVGHLMLALDQPDEALSYGQQAKEIATGLNKPEYIVEVDYLLGSILEKKQNYQGALDNLNNAITIADSLQVEEKSEQIAEAIGRNYRAQNEIGKELNFKEQRRARSIEVEDLEQQNKLDLDIAEIYIDLDQSEEAVPYLQESVELSEQLGDIEQNISARKSLSDVYASSGNYNQALDNYKKYVALVDQLYQNKKKEIELSSKIQQDLYEKQETISLLEKDQELHENEIELLEKDRALQEESIARQQLFIYGLSALIAVIIVSAIVLYRNVQKKKLANQLLAVKSLRSQMNPHFIFNALNSVNSFISKNDTRKANKYLSDFSRLMRTVMENSAKDFVPLGEEISVLELYLKLEHFRFQDKFDYSFEVNSNVVPDEYRIPPMLIQPYIENAIWHGLRYKEDMGHLSVTIDKHNSDLRLQITDDGIGREKSIELKTRNQKSQESTGMKNTQNRIDLLNNIYQSRIKTTVVDINEGKNTGTHVTVSIPVDLIEETV